MKPVRWTNSTQYYKVNMYDPLYNLFTALSEKNIIGMLLFGSVLGSVRHFGMIPMGEKDFDIAVFSTNTSTLEATWKELDMDWREQTDGKGPGKYGFGYHIELTPDTHIDVWLYAELEEGGVRCVGVEEGCLRWYKKFYPKNLPPQPKVYETSMFLPPVLAPFGPYMMPAPAKSELFVADYFGDDWNVTCGGWLRGENPCTDKYATNPFVFVTPLGFGSELHTLKVGEEVEMVCDVTVENDVRQFNCTHA